VHKGGPREQKAWTAEDVADCGTCATWANMDMSRCSRKISEMDRECSPLDSGKRGAQWLMLNNRDEGQAGSPRSPHKHGKRACWGISLLVPSEARPPEVRLHSSVRLLSQNRSRVPYEGNKVAEG
jgi:hypothetical protein